MRRAIPATASARRGMDDLLALVRALLPPTEASILAAARELLADGAGADEALTGRCAELRTLFAERFGALMAVHGRDVPLWQGGYERALRRWGAHDDEGSGA